MWLTMVWFSHDSLSWCESDFCHGLKYGRMRLWHVLIFLMRRQVDC